MFLQTIENLFASAAQVLHAYCRLKNLENLTLKYKRLSVFWTSLVSNKRGLKGLGNLMLVNHSQFLQFCSLNVSKNKKLNKI